MSNTSFRNFNSRLDGLRCDFSRNKLKYSSYLSTSEPRGKNSAPRILRDKNIKELKNLKGHVNPKNAILGTT